MKTERKWAYPAVRNVHTCDLQQELCGCLRSEFGPMHALPELASPFAVQQQRTSPNVQKRQEPIVICKRAAEVPGGLAGALGVLAS